MIREMKKSNRASVALIYSQSIKNGDVTFTRSCPAYDEWDAAHIAECRFVYELDGRAVGYAVIAPTTKNPAYKGVAELSIFVDEAFRRRDSKVAAYSSVRGNRKVRLPDAVRGNIHDKYSRRRAAQKLRLPRYRLSREHCRRSLREMAIDHGYGAQKQHTLTHFLHFPRI